MTVNLATFPESSDYHGYEEWTEAIKKWKREFGGALRQKLDADIRVCDQAMKRIEKQWANHDFKNDGAVATLQRLMKEYHEFRLMKAITVEIKGLVLGDAEASP